MFKYRIVERCKGGICKYYPQIGISFIWSGYAGNGSGNPPLYFNSEKEAREFLKERVAPVTRKVIDV